MTNAAMLEGDVQTIEVLAAAWLAAESSAQAQPGNAGLALEAARLGETYDAVIESASAEELLIAWEVAQKRQAEQLIGTVEWATARRVSELLRIEYSAARH